MLDTGGSRYHLGTLKRTQGETMGIISFIVLGLIAGAIAKTRLIIVIVTSALLGAVASRLLQRRGRVE